MKVLSDNTAQKLKTLLATPRQGNHAAPARRGAATVPPARMWQLHVIGDTVSMDGGFYLSGNGWMEFQPAEIGEAFDGALVVGELTGGTLAVSLKSESSIASITGSFRVFGSIHANEIETGFFIRQFESGPLYFESGHPWKVTATANGQGGASIAMQDGKYMLLGPGPLSAATATFSGGTATATCWLVASISYSVTVSNATASMSSSCSLSLVSTVPDSVAGTWNIPVARIVKSGSSYTVQQVLTGLFMIYASVAEEV